MKILMALVFGIASISSWSLEMNLYDSSLELLRRRIELIEKAAKEGKGAPRCQKLENELKGLERELEDWSGLPESSDGVFKASYQKDFQKLREKVKKLGSYDC